MLPYSDLINSLFSKICSRVYQFFYNLRLGTFTLRLLRPELRMTIFWPKILRPTFTNPLMFGYKYGISSKFVFNLMLARNNTGWVGVSCKSLTCFCSADRVTRLHISLPRRGRNLQISNALWMLVVEFLFKKMVNLNSGRNHLYMKVPNLNF